MYNNICVHACIQDGRTAIQIAQDEQHTNIVELLLHESDLEPSTTAVVEQQAGGIKLQKALIQKALIHNLKLGIRWLQIRKKNRLVCMCERCSRSVLKILNVMFNADTSH